MTAKGIKNDPAAAFANSNIAAPTVGGVTLGTVTTGNNGVTFGVAADVEIKSFKRSDGPSVSRLTTVGDTLEQDDFLLRIV